MSARPRRGTRIGKAVNRAVSRAVSRVVTARATILLPGAVVMASVWAADQDPAYRAAAAVPLAGAAMFCWRESGAALILAAGAVTALAGAALCLSWGTPPERWLWPGAMGMAAAAHISLLPALLRTRGDGSGRRERTWRRERT